MSQNSTGELSPNVVQTSATPVKPKVHPALEFVLLIIPVVMSGFFLVYALTGLILEDRDKLNWSLEAIDVAVWVGSGVTLYCMLVMAYAKLRGVGNYHRLMISSVGHLLLSLILVAVVYIIVRL